MKILLLNIMEVVGYVWQMLVKIQTIHSFISHWQGQLGWMVIILVLEKFLKEWYASAMFRI
jgi:hypothetical protein